MLAFDKREASFARLAIGINAVFTDTRRAHILLLRRYVRIVDPDDG